MKLFNKLVFQSIILAAVFSACQKVDDLPYYTNGTASVLTSSATTIAPPASDSLNPAITFSWTNPQYASDSATNKYVIEIDSAGRNFSKAYRKTVMGTLSATLTAKELNTILLGFGFSFNVAYNVEARVISSYANNNERLTSNTLTLSVTPYKIPPKVALPVAGRLFIVGDATDFGWSNDPAPAFPPAREFTQLGETVWGGIFNMKGNGGYKLLQTQGDWDTQFHMVSGGDPLAGSFVQENADPSFSSPAAGWYKMLFDFQDGTYKLSSTDAPYMGAAPSDLYIVGDATPGGWDNPVPTPSQQFTKVSPTLFELTIQLTAGKSFLLLPLNGNWDHKFGGKEKSFGSILDDGNVPGSNTPSPDVDGMYKITVNFGNHTYSIMPV